MSAVAADTTVLSENLKSNLVLHFNFDAEPVNGKIAGLSGHGNDGEAVGVKWVTDGHHGASAEFGPAHSYIRVPNNLELNPNRFTTVAWIKTSSTSANWPRIFDKSNAHGYDLTMCGDYQGKTWRGQVALEVGESGTFRHSRRRWPLASVVETCKPPSSGFMWMGSKQAGAAPRFSQRPRCMDPTIGQDRSSPSAGESTPSFNGMMDDVMLFNRALSPAEIQALYDAQKVATDVAPPAPTGTEAKPSAAERLKQVKELYDQGLINKDDYDKKVKEIMDSL